MTVGFSALAAAGGGHPPGVILVPFVFAAWVAGAAVSEAIACWRDPLRSMPKSVASIATAAAFFAAVPVSVMLAVDLQRSRSLGWDQLWWLIAFGPCLMLVTLGSLWQLHRGRARTPIAFLIGAALVTARLAWRSDWLPATLAAVVAVSVQLFAAALLARQSRAATK